MSNLKLETALDSASLKDITIISEIGRSERSIVYKVEHNGKPYALKVPCAGQNLDVLYSDYLAEAAALGRLSHPNIPKVWVMDRIEGSPYLISDFIPGTSLDKYIKSDGLDEKEIRAFAIALAGALEEAHRKSILHRDIKPQNILINENQDVFLVDFGMATRLKRENLLEAQMAGTLRYCSPEQIGILKVPVDNRADLYSLGCTLYHCATGHPPFTTEDVTELIRDHATTVPELVSKIRPEISEELAQIIAKLMRKDPDERFASGAEIVAALTHSEADTALPPLFGRELELRQLNSLSKQVADGKSQMILVQGAPGSGKSTLVTQFLHDIQKSGARVLRGRCSLDLQSPFAALKVALDHYVDTLDDMEKERLRQTIGDLAPLLKHFSAKFQRMFSEAPEITLANDSHGQILDALVQLMRKLTPDSNILVLHIDDLQWVDESSAQLLQRLVRNMKGSRVMVIAGTRDDDTSQETVENILHAIGDTTPTLISLGALSETALIGLAGYVLGTAQMEEELLIRLGYQTQGNPYAFREYLFAMLETGVLSRHWDSWSVDLERLQSLNLPNDVVDLIRVRMQRMSANAKVVLASAAIIGKRFEGAELKALFLSSEDIVSRAISEALELHLLERVSGRTFGFSHDCVREALLGELLESDEARIHQQIAEYLDGLNNKDAVFRIAYHYARGTKARSEQAFNRLREAGELAAAKFSDEQAYYFLSEAQQFGKVASTPIDIAFEELLAGVCLRTGRFAGAISACERALTQTHDRLMRARLCNLISKVYAAHFEFGQAWKENMRAYAEIKVKPPSTRFSSVLKSLWMWLGSGLVPLFKLQLRNPKRLEKAHVLAEMLEQTSLLAYFELRGVEYLLASMQLLWPAVLIGPSSFMARAYSKFSAFMAAIHLVPLFRSYANASLRVARALNNPQSLANAMIYIAIGETVRGDPTNLNQCLQTQGHWLDVEAWVGGAGARLWQLQLRGYAREMIEQAHAGLRRLDEVIRFVKPGQSSPASAWSQMVLWSGYAMLGERRSASQFLQNYKNSPAPGLYQQVDAGGYELFYLNELEDFGERGDQIISEIENSGVNPLLAPHFIRQTFIYVCQYHFSMHRRLSGRAQTLRWKKFEKSLKLLKLICDYPVLRGHYYLLEARRHDELGKTRKVLKFLELAEKDAITIDSPWVSFEIARHRAQLFKRKNQTQVALRYAKLALQIAEDGGWLERAKKIRDEFGIMAASSTGAIRRSSGLDQTLDSVRDRMQHYLQALLQVSLSFATVFDVKKVAEASLRQIVTLLGAERAFLFEADQETGQLHLSAGLKSDGSILQEVAAYSNTLVERVRTDHTPVIVSGTEQAALLGSTSAITHDLRSIMVAPLKLREKLLGVIYLDNRLVAGLFSAADLEILLALANHIAIAIETARAATLEVEKAALEKDLELSTAVQKLFLPKNSLYNFGDLQISSFYRPATQCGGDWWWLKADEDCHVSLVVGDVTGHGSGPAMITASVASYFRMMEQNPQYSSLSKMMEVVNNQLIAIQSQEGQADVQYLMTMLGLEIEAQSKVIKIWRAGAPFAWKMDSAGEIESLGGPGDPLGLGELHLQCFEKKLQPGDRIVVYTDGILETQNRNGRQLGDKGVFKLLKQTQGMDSASAAQFFIEKVDEFRQNGVQDDDYTLLVLDIKSA